MADRTKQYAFDLWSMKIKKITRKKLLLTHLQQTIGRDISTAKCSRTDINATGSSDNTKAGSEVLGHSRLCPPRCTVAENANLVMVKSSYE